MKTQLITTVLCAFLSATLFMSCNSDDDDVLDNTKVLNFDGKAYAIEKCKQYYLGTGGEYADGMTSILVGIKCTNRLDLLFYLHVPTQFNSLQPGTYESFPAFESAVLWRAEIADGMKEGTGRLVVTLSGEEYTLTFSGTVLDKPLSGNFTGKIPWYDESN